MTLSTDLTSNRCRQYATPNSGSRERLPHSYVQDSWSRSVAQRDGRFFAWDPHRVRALAMGNEERVEQSSHRACSSGVSSFVASKAIPDSGVTKPTGAKNQFSHVAERAVANCRNTPRTADLPDSYGTDYLIREYVKGLGERRLVSRAHGAARQFSGKP